MVMGQSLSKSSSNPIKESSNITNKNNSSYSNNNNNNNMLSLNESVNKRKFNEDSSTVSKTPRLSCGDFVETHNSTNSSNTYECGIQKLKPSEIARKADQYIKGTINRSLEVSSLNCCSRTSSKPISNKSTAVNIDEGILFYNVINIHIL